VPSNSAISPSLFSPSCLEYREAAVTFYQRVNQLYFAQWGRPIRLGTTGILSRIVLAETKMVRLLILIASIATVAAYSFVGNSVNLRCRVAAPSKTKYVSSLSEQRMRTLFVGKTGQRISTIHGVVYEDKN